MTDSWSQVSGSTLGKIAIGATAYAVGRHTYITDTTASFLKAYWDLLPAGDRSRVVDIIQAARDRDALGDDCDASSWRSVLETAADTKTVQPASLPGSSNNELAVMSAWRGVLEGGVREADDRNAVTDAVVDLFALLSESQRIVLKKDFDFAARINPGIVDTEAWTKLRGLVPEAAA